MTAAKKAARRAAQIIGALSKKKITIPDVDVNQPQILVVHSNDSIGNTEEVTGFEIDASRSYPDVRSFKRKFGLFIPATNTSMESELWSLVYKNQDVLQGVGLHTSNVLTPKPELKTEEDLMNYKSQFLGGLKTAVDGALLAKPQYLIMGMSLEHIIEGLEGVRAPVAEMEEYSRLSWATWHDAAKAALDKYDAKRIGLLTPFDKKGNESATQMFTDLGFEVVASVGFSCAAADEIAHVPDWAKEKAVMELLATEDNKLDAIVQCGTNMSFMDVAEKLEPVVEIPILGINAVTFWYALRENGFEGALVGGGRLLREF